MTPIEDVFMLSIDSKLDYDLLKRICQNGHSRVPVYEEIEVPARAVLTSEDGLRHEERNGPRTMKVKKIIGILLVKQCVLLDPKGSSLNLRFYDCSKSIRCHSVKKNTIEQGSIRTEQ